VELSLPLRSNLATHDPALFLQYEAFEGYPLVISNQNETLVRARMWIHQALAGKYLFNALIDTSVNVLWGFRFEALSDELIHFLRPLIGEDSWVEFANQNTTAACSRCCRAIPIADIGPMGECSECSRAKSRRIARSNGDIRRVRELYAEGSHSEREWEDLLLRFAGRCLRCGSTTALTRDHVVPISSGGSHYIENIQPLCRSCNSWKHTRTIDFRDNPRPPNSAVS
jgi:5-methylcytosine-specific restriction endonuclease McrA